MVSCQTLEQSLPEISIREGNNEKIAFLLEQKLMKSLALLAEHAHIWYNHLYYFHYKHNDADTIIRGEDISSITKSGIISKSYHLALSAFEELNDSLSEIFELLNTYSRNNKTILIPQLFPRFFKSSFNGGSWSNPFALPTNPDLEQNYQSTYCPPVEEILDRVTNYHQQKKYSTSGTSYNSSYNGSMVSSHSGTSVQSQKRARNESTSSNYNRKPSRINSTCCGHSFIDTKHNSIPNSFTNSNCRDRMQNNKADHKSKFPLSRETLNLLQKRLAQINKSFADELDTDSDKEVLSLIHI